MEPLRRSERGPVHVIIGRRAESAAGGEARPGPTSAGPSLRLAARITSPQPRRLAGDSRPGEIRQA